MTEYALVSKPRAFQEIVKEGHEPVHVGCKTRLKKVGDGRYSCHTCLKVGHLLEVGK